MNVQDVRFDPLGAADLPQLAALWNDAPAALGALGAAHPLSERALAQWYGSPDADPGLALAARSGETLVGAVLARAPRRAWADPNVGHVALLVVAPHARGRGIGAALWDAALVALRARGRTLVRLGGESDVLLPGVPALADDATWRFLRRRGVVPGDLEVDLHVDLRVPSSFAPDPARPADGVRLVDDDPAAALAFVERCFPGRWADETAAYAAAGCVLLSLREGERTLGFCAAFRPDDALLGPSLTWHAALPGPVGGLGPLGVDPDVRGRGLGLRIVAEGLAWQRAQGARDVVINWTTLTGFYGRLGARVWRTYQRCELALPPS